MAVVDSSQSDFASILSNLRQSPPCEKSIMSVPTALHTPDSLHVNGYIVACKLFKYDSVHQSIHRIIV